MKTGLRKELIDFVKWHEMDKIVYTESIIEKTVDVYLIFNNNKMSDFNKSLTEERKQMRERVDKLESFLKVDRLNELNEFDLGLLGVQLLAMKTYLRCLYERSGRL